MSFSASSEPVISLCLQQRGRRGKAAVRTEVSVCEGRRHRGVEECPRHAACDNGRRPWQCRHSAAGLWS